MEIINNIDEDNKLKELIEGKRVCLCGPASSNKGTGYGNYIDSFDTVCRINWHLTGKNGWDENLNSDFGKRTDIMFSSVVTVFYSCFFNDIKNRYSDESIYNCFRDLKYVYFVEPIFSNDFQNYLLNDAYKGKSFVCQPDKYSEKMNEIINNFGAINLNLVEQNKFYCNKKYGLKDMINSTSSSGIHTIQAILKHNPKELFITGMNFGNFGKGGTKESMYIHGGETHKKFIEKRKVVGMITTIHTNQFTLKLLKEIFDSYKNIKLDDLIKKNFYK